MMSTEEKPAGESLEKSEVVKQAPSEKKPDKPKSFSPVFTSFLKKFNESTDAEDKLKMIIEFMKESLAHPTAPRFKDFWDAKLLCLTLFKEKINPLLKSELWKLYTELSSEAKRLKDILDEQSAFAIEQIELALKAMEEDITKNEETVQHLPKLEFSQPIMHLKGKMEAYEQLQQRVLFYTTMASRLKDLKTEILKTDMRIRHKNKLLDALSKTGDRVLPKKKELIKEISSKFNEDIELFGSAYFDLDKGHTKPKAPRYKELREDIKALQNLAKFLSLNSQSFNHTRAVLSKCWDVIKSEEKEKKQEFLQRQEQTQQQLEGAFSKIEAFKTECQDITSKEQVEAKLNALYEAIKALGLSSFDFKTVRSKLKQAEEQLLEPFYKKEKEHQQKMQSEKEAKVEKFIKYQEHLREVISKGLKHSLEDLTKEKEELHLHKKLFKAKDAKFLRFEELERELEELILLKKQQDIENNREDLNALKELLVQWEAFKEATRHRVEDYRKAMGNSGFDFEMAMIYREQIDLERARLERALEKVIELEDQIDE